jgi:hypothetical protein
VAYTTQLTDTDNIIDHTNTGVLVDPGYDLTKEKFDAFNHGLEGDKIASNFTNCYETALIASYFELPTFKLKARYGDAGDILFNSTKIMKNITKPLFNCTRTAEQFIIFGQSEVDYYGGMEKFREAATLNLLANAARI